MTNNVYANEADALEMSRLRLAGRCTRCTEYLDHCECPPLRTYAADLGRSDQPPDVREVREEDADLNFDYGDQA